MPPIIINGINNHKIIMIIRRTPFRGSILSHPMVAQSFRSHAQEEEIFRPLLSLLRISAIITIMFTWMIQQQFMLRENIFKLKANFKKNPIILFTIRRFKRCGSGPSLPKPSPYRLIANYRFLTANCR